ncbi:MAG TPA: alpha-1,4-glucan--maltose-1-phosphate maltosyltransferase [Actinomycetota bacterium]|nr:alpha-1,4-glucan--maltose-1-phosphate maltosyltransferase [Actinomycetota bacterium]
MVIEAVQPQVDCGRFPIKRVVGERVVVEADVFADGHDAVAAALRYRRADEPEWHEVPMEPLGNDRWRGAFTVTEVGRYRYTLRGWVDRFGTWGRDLEKKLEAGQDVSVELMGGARLVARAARRARGEARRALRRWARTLEAGGEEAVAAALDPELRALVEAHPDRRLATAYGRELEVVVDRERARFGAWYEFFPRSASPEPGRPGTLADAAERLSYVARMGFDVVYLPPIHPIGRTHRKGRNNALEAGPGDPGSPWAIGSEAGGHTAVHPELGTLEDFDRFVARARELGLEVALDLAYQCSPDHPWVEEHPEWFRRLPDGSVQYAENPPKKYQDIYPLDFETHAWEALWDELRAVVEFWVARGVRIFRVDNPHTKPFAFWEWLIDDVKAAHPDVIFLAEAFTRPTVMYRLAKLGFTQSYTYFAWRNTKWELEQYFGRDLPAVREFFRPNLWPNTPDILTQYLQTGGRAAFMVRLVLAATLGASYGIYGPAFELMEDRPLQEGSEEYLNSEKYEVRHWDLDRPDSLADFVGLVNRIRRENPALHTDRTLRFHRVDNDQLVAYSKTAEEGPNAVLVMVNLDPHHPQEGTTDLDLAVLGIQPDRPFLVEDLLTGARYLWHGPRNYVRLDPSRLPAHLFRVRADVRTERDFEYFFA